MNYKIIANEERLVEFINWLPDLEENEKYYLCLFARKKYGDDEIKSNKKSQLKRFTSNKDRIIEKIRHLEIPIGAWKLKDDIAPQNSLALYITLNPRNMKMATELMGKRCWDLMNANNYNLHAEAMSCIQKSKSRTCYVDFDIDDKEINLDKEWLNLEIGIDNYKILETRGGYHLMIEPKQATEFRLSNFGDNKWYQLVQSKYPVDQSGDQLIPVAGTLQGGFEPKLI